LVAAVATASGRTPEVAGKPYPATVALVRERFGTAGIVVGDRPSTDGALATALDWPFALVLSGVAGPGREEPVPDPPPAFVADDFARLVPHLVAAYAHA
jgi:ribonucleotide monophosphatase NagD (HAD superfamily)